MIAQAHSESLLHWLYTNAPAAWISAVVATAALIGRELRRPRPKRLVVRETPSLSLMTIGPAVRHRITTLFDGQPIKSLAAARYEIYNEGSDAIQKVEFTLTLPKETVVLSAYIVSDDDSPASWKLGEAGNVVRVSIPYVNPFREHRHLLHFLVVADGEVRRVTVNGSGEGWSVRYSPLPNPKQMRRKLLTIPAAIGSLLGIVTAAYLHWLKIPAPILTWKSLLVVLPLFGFFGVSVWAWDRVLASAWYRTVGRQ